MFNDNKYMIISALEANKMHFKTHCFNNNNNNNLFQTQCPYTKNRKTKKLGVRKNIQV